AFELYATLSTPRLLDVRVIDNAEKVRFLGHANSMAQGEELCATALTGTVNDPLPESVTISGTLEGKPFRQVAKVKDVAGGADYLPRTWAKLEIDRLLAENAGGNKEKIVALSKSMYVMTPFTSLLVLENEAMYQQFQVDRGRKDHWALYACPPKIPVVHEPLDGAAAALKAPAGTKPPAEQVLKSILVTLPPRAVVRPGEAGVPGNRVVTVWDLSTGAYGVPILTESEVLGERFGVAPFAPLDAFSRHLEGAAVPAPVTAPQAGGVPGVGTGGGKPVGDGVVPAGGGGGVGGRGGMPGGGPGMLGFGGVWGGGVCAPPWCA